MYTTIFKGRENKMKINISGSSSKKIQHSVIKYKYGKNYKGAIGENCSLVKKYKGKYTWKAQR